MYCMEANAENKLERFARANFESAEGRSYWGREGNGNLRVFEASFGQPTWQPTEVKSEGKYLLPNSKLCGFPFALYIEFWPHILSGELRTTPSEKGSRECNSLYRNTKGNCGQPGMPHTGLHLKAAWGCVNSCISQRGNHATWEQLFSAALYCYH